MSSPSLRFGDIIVRNADGRRAMIIARRQFGSVTALFLDGDQAGWVSRFISMHYWHLAEFVGENDE